MRTCSKVGIKKKTEEESGEDAAVTFEDTAVFQATHSTATISSILLSDIVETTCQYRGYQTQWVVHVGRLWGLEGKRGADEKG